ncbi:MAG: YeeE/YedE family protein [Marinosulfonomonas sp.]|nr:YeeE/YedE family protein [Marinosulfonomonas sp.]
MDMLPFGALAALVGLFGGIILGLAGRMGHFCSLAALETAVYGEDQTRLRMWGIALGTAIIGAFTLEAVGVFDFSLSFYHQIKWNPWASIIGGLVFGYGMAMAGNCGYSALTRFGGGDLRALVVLVVMAIFSFITLNGPLAAPRLALLPEEPSEGLNSIAHLLGSATGIAPFAIAVAFATVLILWALSYEKLRQQPEKIFWAFAVGAAITFGFWGTSTLYTESFGEGLVESYTFTAPLGRTLIWLMTSSAGGLVFSVGSVGGVIIGAFIGSLIKRDFRWEACEDPRELGRQVGGAALMGIGGVTAIGCSVGQGLSAFSTLAYSAPVTLAAIAAGGLLGLRHLIHGFQPE